MASAHEDLLYAEHDSVATITIKRAKRHNAFRGKTCDELIHAFNNRRKA
jgi:2-ketocyclohexanecarboxyl-CoA hydrolase